MQLQARMAERAAAVGVAADVTSTSMVNYSKPILGAKKFDASAFSNMGPHS